MTQKFLSFSVYIDAPEEITAVPVHQNIINNFDSIGGIVSLDRIDEETNVEYRKRIWDTSVHPSGSTYKGVINGMARDFGFLRQNTLKIELKLSSAGEPLAPNPRVDILANKVILYSDWRPNGIAVIDKEIYTYQPDDEGFWLDDLVIAINQSSYFSVSMYANIRPNMHSSCLLEGTTDFALYNERTRADRKTELRLPYVIQDSLIFEDKIVFNKEVTSAPAAKGEYQVDYINGKIISYSLPDKNIYSYHAAIFPLIVDSVPIRINTLNDDNYMRELFRHKTLASGEEINGLPNQEGSEIFHQLFSETEVFWGN